jgi:hypothetical protein
MMKTQWPRILLALFLTSLLFSGLVDSAAGKTSGTPAASAAAAAPVLQPVAESMSYLPIVSRNYPLFNPFGVELDSITIGGGLNEMTAAGSGWIRRNALLWSSVEPTQGARNWSALSVLDYELSNAAKAGVKTILIIRSTPAWAQAVPGYSCGPIRNDSSLAGFAAFASFMRDVVTRYSAPPFNVQYYEMWNEPDVDPVFVSKDSMYGCWGNTSDDNYGGGYYGEMLKVVYPQIKAANATAQVLIGGLLLDCDPNLPGACADSKPPHFLDGILSAGAGAYFDGVSFHAYDYYQNSLGQYYNANWGASGSSSGPVLLAKAQYLKGVLASYNLRGKYLINTESAILSDSACDAACQQTKAYYVSQVYGASLIAGLRANIWFNAFGWRNSGLLMADRSPYPAYNAYTFAHQKLAGFLSGSEASSYPGVRQYTFNQDNRTLWLLWSLDGTSHSVTLPFTPTGVWRWDAVTNTYKADPLSASVNVDAAPLYVELIR